MATRYTADQVMAAAARCGARGVSKLDTQLWEAAMREELGQTVGEQEAHESQVREAGEVRVASAQAARPTGLAAVRLRAEERKARQGRS